MAQTRLDLEIRRSHVGALLILLGLHLTGVGLLLWASDQ